MSLDKGTGGATKFAQNVTVLRRLVRFLANMRRLHTHAPSTQALEPQSSCRSLPSELRLEIDDQRFDEDHKRRERHLRDLGCWSKQKAAIGNRSSSENITKRSPYAPSAAVAHHGISYMTSNSKN